MTPSQAVGRFVVYTALSIAILSILIFGQDFRDPQVALTRIAIFAGVVLVISYVMVRGGWSLPRVPVDTIYHAALILAAVIFFVGDHREREESRIAGLIDQQSEALDNLNLLIFDLEADRNTAKERLESLRQQKRQAENVLARDGAIELIQREADLASELEVATGLTPAVLAILEDLVQECRSAKQKLELAEDWVPSLIHPDAVGATREPLLLSGGPLPAELHEARGRLQDEVIACERDTEGIEEALAKPPGFARLIGLLAVRPHRITGVLSDPRMTGILTDLEAPESEVLEQIGFISKIVAARSIIAEADLFIMAAETRESASLQRIETLTSAKADLESKLRDLDEDSRRSADQDLVWLVRETKEFGMMIWPFLLIMLLGMKFACVRPFQLPPCENGGNDIPKL